MQTVPVALGPRSYEVRVASGHPEGFGPFARDALTRTWSGRSCRRALIVTDTNVEPLVAPFADSLAAAGIASTLAAIPPGEASKSLEAAESLWEMLAALKADRHTAVVAVGGGVVGDLAGFVAATYARGVPLLMVPTTLLAQVDSSVGGKVGVNLPAAKNIVGAFHQPAGVWADTFTLHTLPIREIRCGYAEVVKYGYILDATFVDYLDEHVDTLLKLDPGPTREVVARCCRLKAGVVERDEREETGLRAVLNFGHTVGHAVEAVAGYGGAYRHGEAVAAGMVAECRLAERLGRVGPGVGDRLVALLARFGLPTSIEGLRADDLIDAMRGDKKNAGGRTRFVLPRKVGHVELTDEPTGDDVRAALSIVGAG